MILTQSHTEEKVGIGCAIGVIFREQQMYILNRGSA